MKLFGCLPLEDFEALSESTAELIRDNRHSNIVVIGASGFIGRWLATYFTFMQLNGEFLGTLNLLVRDERKVMEFQNIPGLTARKVIRIDTLSAGCFNHFNSERVVVIFAASSTLTSTMKSDTKDHAGVQLAERVVSFLPEDNVTFVHLSSGGVYQSEARGLDVITRENRTQCASTNPYIEEKIALEKWSQNQSELGRFTARNPRLFSFYGPGLQLDRHFAVGEFMNKARAGLPILITGNPANRRSYLYPTDAIFQLLLQCRIQDPAHTQIGSANPMTILSASETIAKEFGVQVEISDNPNPTLNNYVPNDVPKTAEKNFDQGVNEWARWLDVNRFN
jgi:dTDP-glucose 4,6-dehydratase